jgi:glycosyltransferase involved in cell wall biosynthesis
MADRRIFHFCYSHDRPGGSTRQAYRHVDLLNALGHEAYVLHAQWPCRLTWFEHETRAIGPDEFRRLFRADRDFIVFPDDLGERILEFPGRKVVLARHVLAALAALGPARPAQYPWLHPDVVAAITESVHDQQQLAFAFPHLPVAVVEPGVDSQRFAYRSPASKRRLIACAARPGPHGLALFQALQARIAAGHGALADWTWVFLGDRTERDVADVLGDALIAVVPGVNDGVPLVALEAMASGCLVVAVDAGPLADLLPEGYRFRCGDIVAAGQFIESAAAQLATPEGRSQLTSRSLRGRELALACSLDRQARSLDRAWRRIVVASKQKGSGSQQPVTAA